MKKTNINVRLVLLSLALCIMLTAVSVFCLSACKEKTPETPQTTDAPAQSGDVIEKGTGAKTFSFEVVDKDKNTTKFLIHTDKTTVGEALVEVELIAGDQSEYGLYVKTVNGQTLDYTADGMYWAFYENGVYASKGVDSTDIVETTVYSFVAEAAA